MFNGYVNQLQIAIFNSYVSLQEGKYRDVPLPGEMGVRSVAFPLGAQSVPGDDATCCEVKGVGPQIQGRSGPTIFNSALNVNILSINGGVNSWGNHL